MNRTAPRNLKLESLENRELMAGNVTVNLVAGEAHVTGDNLSNGVHIQEISAGKYRVTGITAGGSKTTVNGKSFVDIFTPQDDLRVSMKGGSDQVLIGNKTGTMTVEDLTVDMGTGADYLELGNLSVYDRVDTCFIRMGTESNADADVFEANNCTFAADLDIIMGAGVDEIEFRNVSIADDLIVNMGSGTDELELVGVKADEIKAVMGSGSNDALELESVTARKLTADGGSGTGDRLELRTGNRLTSKSTIGFERT